MNRLLWVHLDCWVRVHEKPSDLLEAKGHIAQSYFQRDSSIRNLFSDVMLQSFVLYFCSSCLVFIIWCCGEIIATKAD